MCIKRITTYEIRRDIENIDEIWILIMMCDIRVILLRPFMHTLIYHEASQRHKVLLKTKRQLDLRWERR